MNKLRKAFAYTLCLCLLLSASAHAAMGDAILARREFFSGEGFGDQILRMCVCGDELVLIGEKSVYTWKVGEGDLKSFPWSEGYLDVSGNLSSPLAIYSDGADVYLVYGISEKSETATELERVSLWKLVLNGETADIAETEGSELDWELLTAYNGENSSAISMEYSTCVNGVLYGITNTGKGNQAYAVPLDGSSADVLDDVIEPIAVASYKDGRVFFALQAAENPQNVYFIAWDPQEEELEKLYTMSIDKSGSPIGFAYDAANDLVYFTLSGAVGALDMAEGKAVKVNSTPLNQADNAAVLPGGYYVLSGSDNDYASIVVRNTDPSKQAQYSLVVNNVPVIPEIDEAKYTFSNMRGDVSVSVADEYVDDRLVEEMLTQSTTCDIYTIGTTDKSFTALRDRGYMTELTGSEKIMEHFEKMYPALSEQFLVDGVPVAVPLFVVGGTSVAVREEALEKAGLTIDDIPTNWLDLLTNLDALYDKVKDTGVVLFKAEAEDMKSSLAYRILEDYWLYLTQTDPKMGFNTDILRSVLGKLDEIDFSQLGLPRKDESSEDSVGLIVLDDYWVIRGTTENFREGLIPLPMGMTSETDGYVRMLIRAAFINPYSENKEIAMQFLESVLDSLPEAELASLYDMEVEPKLSSEYETMQANVEEEIARLQQKLATADESEKQELEESIRDQEQWLEYNKNMYYWEISPTAIEWYRGHDDALAIDTFNPLYGETYSEIYPYLCQYYDGEIGAEQLLQILDSKLQMIILEGAY